MVERYISDARIEPSRKRVLAVLTPHAGYPFSGPVAGYSFRHIQNQDVDTVLFIALSHQGTEGACIYAGKFFETPLGLIPVDSEIIFELGNAGPPFHSTLDPYLREHSIEVNLPFVQTVFPHARVASVLISDTEPELCQKVGEKIAETMRKFSYKNVLIVVSSDMSHYPDYDTANRVDQEMLKSLETLDPGTIYNELRRLESTPAPNLRCVMCGSAAMLTAVEAARALGAMEARMLSYQNSGDSMFGDHNRVVGYGSLAIYQPDRPLMNNWIDASGLNEDEKKTLLRIARESIAAAIQKQPYNPEVHHPPLGIERGVFVTLKKNGELRGCLGRFDSNGIKLHQLIATIAAESATHDMRFSPVTLDELSQVDIQISILSPLVPVNDIQEIEIGKHGLKIRGRNPFGVIRTGTLLPQVAIEHDWDVIEFLTKTCEKTGIESEAWRDAKTEIFKYEAFIFGDLNFGEPPYQVSLS